MGVFGRRGQPVATTPAPARQGCCAGVSRVVCHSILTLLFLCIAGLSIAGLVGRSRYWAYFTTNSSDPGAYFVKTGWLDFLTRDQDQSSLRTADFGTWIIGIICAAALLLSAVLAILQFFLSITNNCGRHTAGLAFPMGIVLVGILIAYIAAIIIRMRDYTNNTTGTPYTLWPHWGWIVSIIAGGLWFIVGICASSMALKTPRGKQALPVYHEPAGAYPAGGAYAAGAAPQKQRRGWFGRNKAAAPAAGAAAAIPTSEYTAQPFNAPTTAQRDVEMGRQPGPGGVRHNGHAGEAAAAGGAAGVATAAARHHHDNQHPNQTQYATQNQYEPVGSGPLEAGARQQPEPKRRGWFGRNKRAADPAAATGVSAGAASAPIGANQPSAPAMPTGNTAAGPGGGGAWAGSRLAQEERDLPLSEPGTGGATGPYATGRAAAPVGSGPAGVAEPAGTAADTKKGGAFSFYH